MELYSIIGRQWMMILWRIFRSCNIIFCDDNWIQMFFSNTSLMGCAPTSVVSLGKKDLVFEILFVTDSMCDKCRLIYMTESVHLPARDADRACLFPFCCSIIILKR